MTDPRKKLNSIRKAIKLNASYLDFKDLKVEIVNWLSLVKFPDYQGVDNWSDLIKEFPAHSDEDDSGIDKATVVLRLALRLYTTQHQYVISIMECLGEGAEGIGIITLHVNWQEYEKNIQQRVDLCYKNKFDDILRAHHALWTQTFRQDDFVEGLNNCAMTILSNELKGHLPLGDAKESINITHQLKPNFPKKESDIAD